MKKSNSQWDVLRKLIDAAEAAEQCGKPEMAADIANKAWGMLTDMAPRPAPALTGIQGDKKPLAPAATKAVAVPANGGERKKRSLVFLSGKMTKKKGKWSSQHAKTWTWKPVRAKVKGGGFPNWEFVGWPGEAYAATVKELVKRVGAGTVSIWLRDGYGTSLLIKEGAAFPEDIVGGRECTNPPTGFRLWIPRGFQGCRHALELFSREIPGLEVVYKK